MSPNLVAPSGARPGAQSLFASVCCCGTHTQQVQLQLYVGSLSIRTCPPTMTVPPSVLYILQQPLISSNIASLIESPRNNCQAEPFYFQGWQSGRGRARRDDRRALRSTPALRSSAHVLKSLTHITLLIRVRRQNHHNDLLPRLSRPPSSYSNS